MSKDRFIGTWRLLSCESHRSDGSTFYPLTENGIGVLHYDAAGNMGVHLMRPIRPAFASGDMAKGTPEEVRAAFEGYVAYFGTYTVDEEQQSVTHSVEGCTFPNWIGTKLVRSYKFTANRMELIAPPTLIRGAMITNVLVWERGT